MYIISLNNMKKIPNKVIVWGIDDFNTLGLMRELGQPEIDLLFLIRGKKNIAAYSVYCKQYIETDSIEEGYEYLLSVYKKEKCKPIIITNGDDIATFIDSHLNELEPYFILSGTRKKGLLKQYIDKNNMTRLAMKLGILCPQSRYISKSSMEGIEDITYPCLIKPSHEKEGHYNEFKFRVCKNKTSLQHTLKLVRLDSEFIVQQFIPKEGDLLIYGARMHDGKTLLAGALLKDRVADSGSGSHGYMTRNIPIGVDVSLISQFLEHIDYVGPFSFEYGKVGNKAYFFEVNLRNDGTSHYFYQLGANIPLAYVYSAAGLDYTKIPTEISRDGVFVDEIFDVENVLHCKLSMRQWKSDRKEATVYKYFDKQDIHPYQIVQKGKWKQIIQDLILKKYRLYIVYILDKFGLHK